MPKKKTHEEFIKELKDIQPNINIISKYINSSQKVKCNCLVCNNIWEAKASHLLSGHGCPNCNKPKKKTHDMFVREVSLVNKDIEIIGEYVGSQVKVLCKCKIDGYEWYSRPDRLLNGKGCPKCITLKTGIHFKRTNDEFVEELQKINANIKPLEQYVNSNTKILCKCLIDDYEWKARPDQLLEGHGCPKCSGTMKKDHNTFISEIQKIHPNIHILGKYKNSYTHIRCKCNIDGYEWETQPSTLRNGHGCPMCAGNINKTHEAFVEQVRAINPNIEILNRYENTNTKIHCRCKIDGYEWKTTVSSILRSCKCKKCLGIETKTKDEFFKIMKSMHPNIKIEGKYINHQSKLDCQCLLDGYRWSTTGHSLMQGHGCKKCAGTLKKTQEEYIKEVHEKNKNVTIIGEYKGANKKILCKCNKCGNEWFANTSSILYGSRCPICFVSKGETKIVEFLNNNKIEYIPQKTFENCSYKISLRFDFYIPHLNLCIEYQGQQHYEPVDFSGKGMQWANEKFKEGQEKDNIKRNYCNNNNIKLLEIPYWDYENIEEILSRELGLTA